VAHGQVPELAGNEDMKTLSTVHMEAEMDEVAEVRGERQHLKEEEGASVDKKNTTAADSAARSQGGHDHSPEEDDNSYMREAISYLEGPSNSAYHAAVAEEAWEAAHGALRADDGSSWRERSGGLSCLNGSHATELS
jgi:hypothetical protein